MLAVNGYYNGSTIVLDKEVEMIKGQKSGKSLAKSMAFTAFPIFIPHSVNLYSPDTCQARWHKRRPH